MKYTGEFTKEISFPLGGIGSGSIGIAGNGSLVDWEIFNRPSKGSLLGYSHFAIKAIEKETVNTYALNGDLLNDYIGQRDGGTGYGFGPYAQRMCGFPHFKNVEFNGQFPIAELNFSDEKFPAQIKMSAFNPFIPNDAKNSSIPAAFFEIQVENTTPSTIIYQIALTAVNPYSVSRNVGSIKDGITQIYFENAEAQKESVEYGDLTIATDCENAYFQENWYRGKWKDGIITYWNEFSARENMPSRRYDSEGKHDAGTLVAQIEVLPKSSKAVRFVISWNSPNNTNYWDAPEDGENNLWKNYYATVFENSGESAQYALSNFSQLKSRTEKFRDILYNSSMPAEVIDAAAANLSVLKSPTVLRLEDGSFYGWEGISEKAGICEGTCQHVWNYAYALCFLFPELERSIRENEFKYSTDADGKMTFRMALPAGRKPKDYRACLDGQMGSVIKCYREWKISGDDSWLREKWADIKNVLEYAWSPENPDKWDLNKDGVLEGRCHHTLDMELFGPSSWLEGMYLAALKAASEMAGYLGDNDKKTEYEELFRKGYEWTKENLFNGEYFIQSIDIDDKNIVDEFAAADDYWNEEVGEIKYQLSDGSSIDQVLAQWHADILNLGDIFDKTQLDCALENMMKNNFKPVMRDFVNPWRIFALNDESGTVICDYSKAKRKPKIPIWYAEETMTGFEYSFAGILYSRGKEKDALRVVKAVRDRFDGKKRNPWNEFECGSNYARSMASFALIPILSGFEFDMPKKHLGFNPQNSKKFKSLWSIDGAWGEFAINGKKAEFKLSEGKVALKSFGAKFAKNIKRVLIDGAYVDFEFKDGIIYFNEVQISEKLEILM